MPQNHLVNWTITQSFSRMTGEMKRGKMLANNAEKAECKY